MLSVNSTLERLDVSGNNLGSDYFSRCVGPALMRNNSLKVLKFSSCGSNEVSAICEAMVERNATIEELDASNNHIGAVFGERLLKILQKPGCGLRHLDVHGTNLGNDGMATLREGIENNSSLFSLNAAGQQVSCLSFLMEFLWSCIRHPSLEELSLEGTKVSKLDEWKLSGVTEPERRSNVKKLNLSGCSLTNQALRTLAEKAQGKMNQLFYLNVSNNDQLTTECLSSICALTSSDQSNHSLSIFDFSLNASDDIAADVVKLPQLENLKSVLLKKCRISPNSVADLSKLIAMTTPGVPQISSLTLDGIKLSGTDTLKSMLGLSDMFIPITPCSFELLSLTGCGLNDRDVKPLMTAIGNGLIVKELRLSANRLTDTAVNHLLELTGTSLSLEALDLSINKIRNGGAEKLAGALSDKLAILKSLLLSDNCIGRKGILALVGKIGSASQLAVLNLKSQQQALGEEDMDQIMEQLAESLRFDAQSSDPHASDVFVPPSNFSVNLTGLGGEPGELGAKLDSLAVLTDYSSKHRRTLTFDDALQLSAVLSQTGNTRSQISQSDWNRVISADKDAPGWLQISSQRACAIYVSNLPLSVTAEKLEGQLDNEAECNVTEVYLLKDQILRKPNGLAWVLFTDAWSVQRAVEYYNSGQAFMYGTPFVIAPVNVDVIADTDTEENALAKARQEMNQRAEDRKADQTAHAQLVQSNYSESLARHEYAAQHPAYADGRVW